MYSYTWLKMNNWSRNLIMARVKVPWNNIYGKDSLPCHENYVKYLIAYSTVSTLILKLLVSTNAALSHPIPSPSLICFFPNGPQGATNEGKDSVIIIIIEKKNRYTSQDCRTAMKNWSEVKWTSRRRKWIALMGSLLSAIQPVQLSRLPFLRLFFTLDWLHLYWK